MGRKERRRQNCARYHAKAARLKAEKKNRAEIEQSGESSKMAEIGNTTSTSSIPQEIEKTKESHDHFLLSGEDSVLPSDRCTISQNQLGSKTVKGSDENMAVASANEEFPSTNLNPIIAYDPQETNARASNLFPIHAFNEGLLHGSPEDGIDDLDSNQPNPSYTPCQQHQKLATTSPTLMELIDWNAGPDFAPTCNLPGSSLDSNQPNPSNTSWQQHQMLATSPTLTELIDWNAGPDSVPSWSLPSPSRTDVTELDTIALSNLETSSRISPGPITPTEGDPLTPLPAGLWSPQFPLERSSPPQVSSMPARVEEQIDDSQAADQFMSDMVWPGFMSDEKNSSED